MRNPVLFALAALAALPAAAAAAAAAAAQGERYTLRPAPAPNQVLRIEMTQDMAFDMLADGLPPGGMRMEGRFSLAGVQRVGAPDSAGRIRGEFSYDRIEIGFSANGQPLPLPGDVAGTLVGKVFAVIWGADGKIAEVRAPPEAGGMGASVQEMIRGLAGSLPSVTLGLGDTVTVVSDLALPVPGLGGPSGNAALQTRVRFKLVGVEREGGDRIALLDQTIEAGLSGSEFTMSGTGRMRWNLDRNIPQLVTTDATLAATVPVPAMGGTLRLSGTMRMTMRTAPDAAPPPP